LNQVPAGWLVFADGGVLEQPHLVPYFDVGNPIINVMMISHERNFLQPREGKSKPWIIIKELVFWIQ
jgi:hypothetical protein